MYSDKLQLNLVNTTPIRNVIDDSHFTAGQAGYVKHGSYAWVVHDSTLEILSTETGVMIAHYNFGKHQALRSCVITCVEEIEYLPGVCLLAVVTEFIANSASVGMISIFCVQGAKILGSMDFCERITCCRYIDQAACQRSILRQFQGTFAIGTDQGKLFLIDLMIPTNVHDISMSPSYEANLFPCVHTFANVEQTQIALTHQKAVASDQQMSEKSFFSIQLEVLNDSGSVLSILCMPNLYTMAVGLNDGRLVLYDLSDLQAFHLAYPPNTRAPLTHMSFMEPTDDPRCAVYIWAFHNSNEGAIAVMHSLMYSNKVGSVYDDFKSCSVRLTMPIYMNDTVPICCRSITRSLTQDEEDVLTLNVLAWTSPGKKTTNIMIFDLNQWYKEEMPNVGDWRMTLKYVAVFEQQNCAALDVIVNENSVFPFNSIMRPEEHFYPNSLSFDACLLEHDKFSHYRWFGIQNIVLQQFNVIGPQIILEPSYYFNELLQVAILPQFSDAAYNVSTKIDRKREFLLSVALEYNFYGFLKKCAWSWADGSYLGKDGSNGIGLSTLTDWIWNRVREIKDVCNTLCRPLFDYSEQRIDYGTQKQLSQCSKQLKVLSELLIIVLRDYCHHIPEHVLAQLTTQSETIKMASDYQEVLQWLLNVGLLPEGHDILRSHDVDDEFLIVPYPYQSINSYYNEQRMKLSDGWVGDAKRRKSVESSKYLFIDAFIEKECNSKKLREIWNGIYPPKSIQALLRTLLVPDISLHNKHVIFVYLFMDITNVLSEGAYASIVRNLIKFPAVFKMNPAMIKRTQAFWNLDNGRLDTAVEELISPLSHDKHLPLWQRELLIGALLKQNANSLALRALRCPGSQISPDLEMLTLLSNNLMSEALKVQRASGDRNLLEKLFEKILHSPSYEQLLDLSLTEEEGSVLREYLQNLSNSDVSNLPNIHFVFLLQRSKFLEAAQLVESLGNETNMNLDPPKQVLNAYYASMESTTRRLTSMVYTEDTQVKESPLPLSVNLIQARCNAKNDIYQKCVQSITEAAYETTLDKTMPFLGSPKLGIFEYKHASKNQLDLSYMLEINEHGKRKQIHKTDEVFDLSGLEAPRQKKRRLDNSIAEKREEKRKSYMDMRINNLTVFKDAKPNYSFVRKSPGSSMQTSMQTTPERVHLFGNFLNTPIVEKKTPPRRFPERGPATPHSILKTRSCRGSVSPVPSRISEFGDDNKSVKSITFAALPDSRDTSINDSFNEEQMESSAEMFFSPGKSPEMKPTTASNSMTLLEGPKVRKPIKSRSTTPVDPTTSFSLDENKSGIQETVAATEAPVASQEIAQEVDDAQLNDTVSSSDSQDYAKPFREGSVLKTTSSDDDSSSAQSEPDKSIYNYVRRSVLPDNYNEESDSSTEQIARKPAPTKSEASEDSEAVDDEHFEEEELPEHSDYDDSSDQEENGDGYEYGNLDLDDSESESQQSIPVAHQKSTRPAAASNEVICLDSSSEDDETQIKPSVLPSFNALGNIPDIVPSSSDLIELVASSGDDTPITQPTQEEMFSIIYENVTEPMIEPKTSASEEMVVVEEDIESPAYEEIIPMVQSTTDEDNPFPPIEPVFEGYQIVVEVPEAALEEVASSEDIAVLEAQTEPDSCTIPQEAEEVQEPIINMEIESSTSVVQTSQLVIEEHEDEQPETAQVEVEVPISAIELETVTSSQQLSNEDNLEVETATIGATDILANVVGIQNASEMSDENLFVSATDEDLDEAVIIEETGTQVLADTTADDSLVGESIEVSNILDKAQLEIESSHENVTTTEEMKTEIVTVTEESPNPFNLAQLVNDGNLNETQPLDLTKVPRSTIVDHSDRFTRARSVPSSGSSSPRSRSQRASTEDRDNPKNLLKGKILERIEESVTPVPSPGPLTRRRSQLALEASGTPETPTTPKRLTRRTSQFSDDGSETSKISTRRTSTGTPTTPRRLTRAASKESSMHSETEKTPEEAGQLTRQKSLRAIKKQLTTPSGDEKSDTEELGKPSAPPLSRNTRKRAASASGDDNDDAKSTRSTRSSTKKSTASSRSKVTPDKLSPLSEHETPSTSNRRLTRGQMQVIEKSQQIADMISKGGLRATQSENIIIKHEDSDNESVKSDSGSVASSRASRKRKVTKKSKDDDSSSVASRASRYSESPKKPRQMLSIIPEESTIDESNLQESGSSKSVKSSSQPEATLSQRTRKAKK